MAWGVTKRAFVSSTFLDLQEMRRIVGDQLVSAGVLPIGMEIFPASGTGPWEVIRSAIDTSDFYILIVGGRYGSLAPYEIVGRDGVSWTHLEYEYARQAGKPIIALLHGSPELLPRHAVDDTDSPVWAFRKELAGSLLVRYFDSDMGLVAGLHTSLIHLMESKDWHVTRPPTDVKTDDLAGFLRRTYDRHYELVGAAWSHRESTRHPGRWDANCQVTRTLRPHWPEGLSVFAYTLTKPSGDFVSFFPADPPVLTLTDWERADSGSVTLRDRPRRMEPASFIQDLDFMPPLRQGELGSFRINVDLPGYRFAYRDDVKAASAHAPAGVRDYEVCSYDLSFPTDRLLLSVTFPAALEADVLGFRVRKNRTALDQEEMTRLEQYGCYTVTKLETDTGENVVASLDVPNPVLKRSYEIRWRPPRRS